MESSSDSDSDGPERSRKHRRRDSSKKACDSFSLSVVGLEIEIMTVTWAVCCSGQHRG